MVQPARARSMYIKVCIQRKYTQKYVCRERNAHILKNVQNMSTQILANLELLLFWCLSRVLQLSVEARPLAKRQLWVVGTAGMASEGSILCLQLRTLFQVVTRLFGRAAQFFKFLNCKKKINTQQHANRESQALWNLEKPTLHISLQEHQFSLDKGAAGEKSVPTMVSPLKKNKHKINQHLFQVSAAFL